MEWLKLEQALAEHDEISLMPHNRFGNSSVLISFRSIEHLTGTKWENHTSIAVNAIHIWGIELDGSSRCLARCTQWLAEEEQHRAQRMFREEDRRRYVLAHGGLRAVLSRYLGVGPDRVELLRSEAGKPSLAKELGGRPALTFNMSHAHDRALIAVSKGQEIGVDIERIRSDVEVAKLSERYFTPSEHTAIIHSTQEQRATRFFRYWVAKEAVLKARGIGISGLSQCEIFFDTDGVGTEVAVLPESLLQNSLRVCLLPCDEGWEAAVAAQDVGRIAQGSPI